MTNKQNDENVNAISDDSVEAKPNAVNSDECIRLEGERSPVKNDEKTIMFLQNRIKPKSINQNHTANRLLAKRKND